MTVKLTGTIEIPMDLQNDLLPLLHDHVDASRAEPGNIRFDITQDPKNREIFHLDEAFKDEEAFAFHQTRGAATPWGQRSKNLARNFQKTSE